MEKLRDIAMHPGSTLVCVDYDGATAPFHVNPAQVQPYQATSEAGWAIRDRFRWTAALTGREDTAVERHLPWADILATTYGASVRVRAGAAEVERWRDGRFFDRAPEAAALVSRFAEAIEGAGMLIDWEGPTTMIHFRALQHSRKLGNARRLLEEVAEAAAVGERLVPVWFPWSLDIRPGEISKAIGLRRVLRAAGVPLDVDGPTAAAGTLPPTRLVLIADDVASDLEAFREARRRAQEGVLENQLNVAVVHLDRPQNQLLWDEADVCVLGVEGATSFMAGLAAAASCHLEEGRRSR